MTRVRQLRDSLKKSSPGLRLETELWEAGHHVVAGLDEVGKGAWAGPLTVGAVVVPKDRRIYKVRDSKLLCDCLLYTSPSPRDRQKSRMPSSA